MHLSGPISVHCSFIAERILNQSINQSINQSKQCQTGFGLTRDCRVPLLHALLEGLEVEAGDGNLAGDDTVDSGSSVPVQSDKSYSFDR